MKHIAKVLPTDQRALPERATSATDAPASNVEPIRQSALRRFWSRMAGIYGHRWNSAFGDAPEDAGGDLTIAGDTWKRGLLGVTETQIGVGITACIASAEPWPPTLPEFRALCLGVPSIGEVRALVSKRSGASPFIRLVWQHIDGWNFARADQHAADRMLRDAYEIAREHVMRGGELPADPAGELTHQPEPAPQVEVREAAAVIADLAGALARTPPAKPVAVAVKGAQDLATIEAELREHYAAKATQAPVDATGEG